MQISYNLIVKITTWHLAEEWTFKLLLVRKQEEEELLWYYDLYWCRLNLKSDTKKWCLLDHWPLYRRRGIILVFLMGIIVINWTYCTLFDPCSTFKDIARFFQLALYKTLLNFTMKQYKIVRDITALKHW